LGINWKLSRWFHNQLLDDWLLGFMYNF
jgi:hypothetical protein